MKLKTFLISAGLMFGMITGAFAQTTANDSIRLRIVKGENGTFTNIDTTVAAAQHDQLMIWLTSQGIELPPHPPAMPGDSLRMKRIMIVEMEDSIGGEGFMRMPFPPPAPGEPLPPPPPGAVIMRMPAPAPGHEGDRVIIICDSTMKNKECKKVIVTERIEGAPKRPAAPKREMKTEMKSNELVVYPNPSKGQFTLAIDLPGKGKADLLVTDMNGKTVYAEQIAESEGKITKQIDLSKNGKGMYSIRLSKNGKVIVENIVVE
jgi:hypothetical protein